MSEKTIIQWCDTTVNPIMGCAGCELFPAPKKVLEEVAKAMNGADPGVNATMEGIRKMFKQLVDQAFQHEKFVHQSHQQKVTTTNIGHLRDRFADRIREQHGPKVAQAVLDEIARQITCYAGKQHLNKGTHILDREGARPDKDQPREFKEGFAPTFEAITQFEGRSQEAAELSDLLGVYNPKTPWKERLPRLIFVSDMGDALSSMRDFPFLKSDLMPAITSDQGKRHLWLWLTKRPGTMVKFAEEIGGFPENVCAMTSLTGPDPESLKRLEDLKMVKAHIRGLSIEPMWNRIPPSKLNLKGIDWVIVGGESGSGLRLTRPFALEWAEGLRDHCRKNGVAFFLKQLGRNPSRNGVIFRLEDAHGGDWHEWPDEALKIREFPKAFHEYRRYEMVPSDKPRPVYVKKPKKAVLPDVTPEEKADFKRLDKIVRRGVEAFMECGKALAQIHDTKLWRAGGWATWEDYCRQVAGLSKSYASRLINASRVATELVEALPIGNPSLPVSESQVRPLLKLADAKEQAQAWITAVDRADGNQPTAIEVQEVVFEILNPGGSPEKTPSRSQQRADLVARLKLLVAKRKSWSQIEELVAELEDLL